MKKNCFDNILGKDRALIELALKKYINNLKSASPELREAVKYAVFSGGKKLRPTLCLEAARAVGGNINKAIPSASAIELIHNFSLVHDDLPSMDNDSLRRGKPTCHVKYGEAVAVLAGDALLNLAFNVLCSIKDKGIFLRTIRAITSAIGTNGMIGGQALDIKYMNKAKGETLSSRINILKTARLFSVSTETGAIAAGSSEKKIRRLKDFGYNFGIAFQIYDDIKDKVYRIGPAALKKGEIIKIMKKAKSYLEIFGKKADNLRYLADALEGKILDT